MFGLQGVRIDTWFHQRSTSQKKAPAPATEVEELGDSQWVKNEDVFEPKTMPWQCDAPVAPRRETRAAPS